MKRLFSALALGVAVWAFPVAGTVRAADITSRNVAVPFAFKVNKLTLPAGQYRVEQFIGKNMVFLVNMQSGHRVGVMRENVDIANGNTKLTFEKIGAAYKLSKIS